MLPVRKVVAELLDELEPDNPQAIRSRNDLRRVHRAMGSVSILKRELRRLRLTAPRRMLELGAGDGTLSLRLARALPEWRGVALTLLDRHDLLSAPTRRGYAELGWDVAILRSDALKWAVEDQSQPFDLCVSTLFLHHFKAEPLKLLLRSLAARCNAFIACEPRRDTLARLGSQLIGLLGVNAVTRGDAVKSVEAGFNHHELTSYWPHREQWTLTEHAAPPFTHCFTAVRRSV